MSQTQDPAELAVTDGMPLPADLPRGEVITYVVDGILHIGHADRRVLISAELLDTIAANPSDLVSLDRAPCADYTGAFLEIRAANRQISYLITEQVRRVGGYIGEWPR